MKAKKIDRCIGGLHEVCVGVPNLNIGIADYESFGCHVGSIGELTAKDAHKLYGVNSAVRSVRLLHQDSDHGLVRLMQWDTPLNTGLGMGDSLRCEGSRWGVRVTDSALNILNHAQKAREAGMEMTLIEPMLATIGEVTGYDLAQPFRTSIIGVREMVLLQPHYRHVIFERFGYESQLYGKININSLLRTSQHTHFGLMIANDDKHVLDFYDEVLGLNRWMDEEVSYENATGSRNIFGLEPDEGFHMVDFDDPRSGHSLKDRRSGKLKCVRLAGNARIEYKQDRSRAGCLGYSLYCWRAKDIELMHKCVSASGVSSITDILPDEFGRLSFTFTAPDGYQWLLLQI